MGIGPTQSAWKADILPLNYTRTNAEMQSQKTTSTFQCLTILPYRTIDVKKNERLSQFLYPLTPSKTAIALIPLHCPITYPTHRYKHMQSARFKTIWAVQFIDEASTLNKRCCRTTAHSTRHCVSCCLLCPLRTISANALRLRLSLLAGSPGIGVRTATSVSVILSHIIPLYKKNIVHFVRYFLVGSP